MSFIENKATARIPTKLGVFQLYVYLDREDKEHTALVMGNISGKDDVLTRIHSECYTGDIFGSMRCDCGEQLHRSMELIAEIGLGVLIYLRQEGRGIGLVEKLKAYSLQDRGHDTVEANLLLGHKADNRDYTVAGDILQDLNVKSLQLLTNNPEKINALQKMGIKIKRRVPIYGTINQENEKYLQTKVSRMNHFPKTELNNEHRIF